MNGQRLSAKEKDARFSPLYASCMTQRIKHGELLKLEKSGGAEKLVKAAKKALAAAKEVVAKLTETFGLDDIKMAAAYFIDAVFQDAMSLDGKNWDPRKAMADSKVLRSLPDDRHLPGGDKDRKSSLVEQRLRSVEAYIRLYSTIGWVPRNGYNDRGLRAGLRKLDSMIGDAQTQGQRATFAELREVRHQVVSSFPKSWLEERQPQGQQNPTLGDTLPEGGVDALKERVASGNRR